MTETKILEYAIIGVNQKISDLDKDLRKGQKIIEQYYKGEQIATKLPIYEIEEICRKKSAEIKQLEKEKDEIKWQLAILEQ